MWPKIINIFKKIRGDEKNYFDLLPEEICIEILKNLDRPSLCSMAQVNEKMLRLSKTLPHYNESILLNKKQKIEKEMLNSLNQFYTLMVNIKEGGSNLSTPGNFLIYISIYLSLCISLGTLSAVVIQPFFILSHRWPWSISSQWTWETVISNIFDVYIGGSTVSQCLRPALPYYLGTSIFQIAASAWLSKEVGVNMLMQKVTAGVVGGTISTSLNFFSAWAEKNQNNRQQKLQKELSNLDEQLHLLRNR